MVAEFVPIFGSAADFYRMGERSIFIDKWTEMRQIYSGVENFQPGDLQAVTSQLMNLQMQMAHAERTLRIMQTALPSASSHFNSPEALLTCCGWKITAMTARQKYIEWHNKYNLIVSAFNKINWIKDLVPGVNRWAALCRDIYKDTSADTDYCQLMMFRPRCYYSLTSTADSEGIITWSLTPTDNFYQFNTENETVAVQMWEEYLDKLYSDVLALYYDSSVNQIVSTLIQVSKLMKEDIIMHFDVPYLTMEPDPISFTWDFAVMLAWHNMTLCDIDLATAVATVHGREGTFTQVVNVNPGPQGVTKQAARILNLPCFSPTNADVANATQWMVITDKLHGDQATELHPSSYGTEIIARMFVGVFPEYSSDPVGSTALKFTLTRWYQDVSLYDSDAASANRIDGIGSVQAISSVVRASNFAYAPLLYNIHHDPQLTTEGQIQDVIGQLEVTYAVTFNTLSEIHNAWVANFWGFPVNIPREGQVTLQSVN